MASQRRPVGLTVERPSDSPGISNQSQSPTRIPPRLTVSTAGSHSTPGSPRHSTSDIPTAISHSTPGSRTSSPVVNASPDDASPSISRQSRSGSASAEAIVFQREGQRYGFVRRGRGSRGRHSHLGTAPRLIRRTMSSISREYIEFITDHLSSSKSQVKIAVFQLREYLSDDAFAESFIESDGVRLLVDLMTATDGNTAAYALEALKNCMAFVSGLEYTASRPGVVRKLVALVSSPFSNVIRNSLALIFVVAKLSDHGYAHIRHAFDTIGPSEARRVVVDNVDGLLGAEIDSQLAPLATSAVAYWQLVQLIGSGDLGTATNALTLLNVLLDKSPNRQEQRRFLIIWGHMGLFGLLDRQIRVVGVNDRVFGVQLAAFQALCDTVGIPLEYVQYRESVWRGFTLERRLAELVTEQLHASKGYADAAKHMRQSLVRFRAAMRAAASSNIPVFPFAGRAPRRVLEGVPTTLLSLHEFDPKSTQEIEEKVKALEIVVDQYERAVEAKKTQLDAVRAERSQFQEQEKKARVILDELKKEHQDKQARHEAIAPEYEKVKTPHDEIHEALHREETKLKDLEAARSHSEKLNKELHKRSVTKIQQAEQEIRTLESPAVVAEKVLRLKATVEALLDAINQNGPLAKDTAPHSKTKASEEKSKVDSAVSGTLNASPDGEMPTAFIPPPPPIGGMVNASSGDVPPPPRNGSDDMVGGVPPPPPSNLPPPPGNLPPPPLLSDGCMPPPPPMFNSGIPTHKQPIGPSKPKIKPKKKMRAVYWKRMLIDRDASTETVWSNLVPFKIDEDELCAVFAKARKVKPKQNGSRVNPKTKKSRKGRKRLVRCLDEKRSNALAIMSSQLPELDELKLAIVEMNQTVLNENQLAKMIKTLPTARELKLIQAKDGPNVNWDKPERFCLMIQSIPRVAERLRAWLFAVTVPGEVQDCLQNLDRFRKACDELVQGNEVPRLLGLIIAIGNYANGGTTRGRADGFKLDILSKLRGVKTTDGKSDLLQYVAQVAVRRGLVGKAARLRKLYSNVLATASIPGVDELKGAADRHIRRFKDFQKTVESVKAITAGNTLDKFATRMDAFVEEHTLEFNELLMSSLKAESAYRKCYAYFGDALGDASPNHKQTPSSEFFASLRGFFRELIAAMERAESRDDKGQTEMHVARGKRRGGRTRRRKSKTSGARERIARLRAGAA